MQHIQKHYNLYENLGYWFLVLVLLAVAGFYTSYLLIIFQPTLPIIHIHFVGMTLWMMMLVAQPFLIKYKKLSIHRMLGKISYVLVPLVLLSGFLMIRHSYYREIDGLQHKANQGLILLNNDQILQQAAAYEAIAFFWLFMFITFYSLAIINRRNSTVHARYMLATALSLLGPIVDRIVFFVFKLKTLTTSIPIEVVAFFIADIVLAILLWKDYQEKRPIKALRIALLIYIIGQVLYFTIPYTSGWQHFVALVMKPNP